MVLILRVDDRNQTLTFKSLAVALSLAVSDIPDLGYP